MAEALVFLILEQLNSIDWPKIGENAMIPAEKEAENLKRTFEALQNVLVDAERRQVKEDTTRIWLDSLKNISYDIEDMLDELNYNKLKVLGASKQKEKVCLDYQVYLKRGITYLRIKDLSERLEEINRQKDLFNFTSVTSKKPVLLLRESTSSVDISRTYKEEDYQVDNLVRKLLHESNEGKGPETIFIVGTGASGKTTLVRLVFDHDQVRSYFDQRMWVDVSNKFQELEVAKSIFKHIEVMDSSEKLDFYLLRISQSTVGKRFLLVLDNVAMEDSSQWLRFRRCLINGLYGSKILIITRKESVAYTMESNDNIIPISKCSEKCWPLFSQIAFSGKSFEECEEIGRKILGKCKGLSLAVRTIGGVLRFKTTKEEWTRILNSDMWQDKFFKENISYPLWLSYYDLPFMVRQCFSYCAIFPKGYRLNKDELIKLWMAQGYLEIKEKEMEAVGEEYFRHLVSRSLFQDLEEDYDGRIIKCKMHYLVHDFLQFLHQNECFLTEVNTHDFGKDKKLCHSMLMLKESVPFPDSMRGAKKLRTLLIQYGVTNCSSISEALPKLADELTSLRALDLSGQFWYKNVTISIPKKIEKLIHLRYLNLCSLKIVELPEELCELYYLQTLVLSYCTNLKKLPKGMGKLINLRHLVNDGTSLSYMPKGIESLTSLRTLSEFFVAAEDEACTLASLKNWNNLQGSLSIKELGTVTDVSTVKKEELTMNKRGLVRLCLNFENDEVEEARMSEDEEKKKMKTKLCEEIFEALEPPRNLEFLEIKGYKGSTFRDWIMSLSQLKTLNLHNCTSINHLSPLGKLPSLESLSICSISGVKRVGDKFWGITRITSDGKSPSSSAGAFGKLKSLKFVNMEEWEDWDCGSTIMPCLNFLSLVHCPKLKELPQQFLQTTMLRELAINWCPNLKKCYRQTEEGWEKISSIPNIMINFEYVKRDGH